MVKKSKVHKEALKVLEGSSKFKTEVSLLVFKFEKELLEKILQETKDEASKGGIFQMAQSNSSIVLIAKDPYAKELYKTFKKDVLEYKKGLAAIVVMSSKKAVETPGVLNAILDIFSENKINLVQLITCYTDITLVIKKDKLFKALDALGLFMS